MRTRIISLVMVLALVFTLLPVYAIADAGSDAEITDGQSIDIQQIVEKIQALISGGGDISSELGKLLEGLDAGTISSIIEQLGGNSEAIKAILEKLGSVDKDELVEVIKQLIGGGNIDIGNIGDLLPALGDADINEIIASIVGGNDDISGILDKIPADKLVEAIKTIISGGDIGSVLPDLSDDQISAIVAAIIGQIGGGDISGIIGNISTDQLIEIIKALVNGDVDISEIVSGLDTDKIVEIIKGLVGDNDTISSILEKLDSEKLMEVIKALINGGDISGIIGNLDAYTLLKVIAGMIGSELDVTGPADVTVTEGETATFNVKVNSKATGLKYMWIEPSVVKGLDLGGIDFSGSKLEIAMKLFQALSKVSLSTTDTLELKNTAAADNGRTFACVIYNIALKDITLFVTDEAKLTVTPVVPCQHVKVIDTPAIAATCTTDGRTEGSHCSVCNEVLSVSEVIKATGHDFSDLDGIRCKNCGEYVPFPFTDVPKTAWCRSDVEYVWQHGIMKGISTTKFGPDTKMTRAMFVTVLYRMEGSPSVEGMQIPAFTDIGAKWCYDAIIWAYNAGVTLGKTATTFAPNDSITRAEIVTMVYRYSGSPTVSGVPNFTDAASVGAWARDAIIWATSVGVVNGYTDGSFGPNKTALRSEMAAMLHRYMEFVKVV